jgi:hypothetical protein
MSHFLHRPGLPSKENGAPHSPTLGKHAPLGLGRCGSSRGLSLLADRRHHTYFGRLLDVLLYSERGISYQLAQHVHAEQDPAVPR